MSDPAESWRQCLRLHGAALLLFARQWSTTQADAEDAMQNGFVKFWKTRDRARDPLAYLYACVRSAAMDLGRGRRRRSLNEQAAARPESSLFDPPLERTERQALIESALAQLPGDQREVVVMKIWGGLTFAQIAATLRIPLNTAASRYRYALARLGTELAEVARD